MKRFMKISPLVVAVTTSSVLLSIQSVAHAQNPIWQADVVQLSASGAPDVVHNAWGTASVDRSFTQEPDASVSASAHTTAGGVPKYYPYRTGTAGAYNKQKVTFTWLPTSYSPGAGTSILFGSDVTWGVWHPDTYNYMTVYATAGYNGVSAGPAASGSNSVTPPSYVNTNGASIVFSVSTSCTSGYGGGGYTDRFADITYKLSMFCNGNIAVNGM
jgi:hypothetical protein